MTVKAIGYWVTTTILAFVWLSGGVADLLHREETVAGVMALGYPLYFVSILGLWKILAALAIVAPGYPRLKEWAYAGTVFELTGAVVSQAVNGARLSHLLWPGFFALCAVASWALRPPSRIIGTLFPVKMWPAMRGDGAAALPSR